jgi:hypothetical protein
MSTLFKINERWKKRWFTIGLILFVLGTIDPLEGSPLLLLGSYLMAQMKYLTKETHWKHYKLGALLIALGFVALHISSYLGGFGPDHLSWWWAIFLIPYPLGWLFFVYFFFRWVFKF